MKKAVKNAKKTVRTPYFLYIAGAILLLFAGSFLLKNKETPQTESVSVAPVSSQILASGSIKSENEAQLHFQTGGKVVYLPFKEGDRVYRGQTVAQLDTYALQRQLTAALNTYKITRNTFDQTLDNAGSGLLGGVQQYNIEVFNKRNPGGDTENGIIGNMVKRLLEQNQANLDTSVINVELANYAVQLASLTSPINGIIYHEDINVPYVNVSPATTFTVIDPDSLIFRANVSENDIDFISIGSPVTIQLDTLKGKTFSGIVAKIFPGKITLPSGAHVYQVDIQSDELKSGGKYDQAGSALIKSNIRENLKLIPIWTVLGSQYVWVIDGNKPILKKITTGDTHGELIEVVSGLSDNDKVIVNPRSVVSGKYQIL